MTTYVDARPAGINLVFRQETTLTLTLEWPAGSLAGRTFTSTLDGVSLTPSVIGDTMTIEVTDIQTAAVTGTVEWLLLEDIAGTPEPIFVGKWTPHDGPSAVSQQTVQVTQGAATVNVTVFGIATSVGDLTVGGDLSVGDPVTLVSESQSLVPASFLGFSDLVDVGLVGTTPVTLTAGNGGSPRGVVYGPTITLDSISPFSGGRSFDESVTLKNSPGVAQTMPHQTGFYAAATIQADGAVFTTDRSSFLAAENYQAINGGSIVGSHRATFEGSLSIGAGVAMSLRRGLRITDATGAGTLTEQVAVDIPLLLKATTNIGIRNAAPWVAPPRIGILGAPTSTIGVDAQLKRLDNTSGGPLTLTATPTIADAPDGTILMMFNGSVNAVTLQDGPTFNLRLGAATRQLDQGDALILMFSATLGDWVELVFAGSN
jgi:hypothetical protein